MAADNKKCKCEYVLYIFCNLDIYILMGSAWFSELWGLGRVFVYLPLLPNTPPHLPFIHWKSSDLCECHESSCWRLGGFGPLDPCLLLPLYMLYFLCTKYYVVAFFTFTFTCYFAVDVLLCSALCVNFGIATLVVWCSLHFRPRGTSLEFVWHPLTMAL